MPTEPTTEQIRAREFIATIEGTNLLCELRPDLKYVVKSELGAEYVIDRNAEHIWRKDNGEHTDLARLEMEADDPMFHGPYCDPADAPDHNEGVVGPLRGPLTDFDEDRYREFVAEAERVQHDRDYYRRREAA